MKSFYESYEDAENDFLLHIKIVIQEDLFEFPLYFLNPRELTPLSKELVKVYEQDLQASAHQTRDMYSIIPQNKTQSVLVESHETGPEVFLIPMVSFVAGAAVTGVIGNLAYDTLKVLLQASLKALRRFISEYYAKDHELKIDKFDATEDDPAKVFEIILVTPTGWTRLRFDREEGLAPDTVKYLAKKIEKYQQR